MTTTSLSKLSTFVSSLDVQNGQPLRQLTPAQTVVPTALVSCFVFFMWGLAYGLLDIMNYHVKVAMNIGREEAAILAAGYYTAYIPGALLLGGPLVKKCGYRVTINVGLLLLGLGDIFMSLGASKCSLAGMVAAHFIIGLGVSMLERSANPYAVNCGPRHQATLRILVAQAFAGIGTVVAPFLANAFVFNPDTSRSPPIPDPLRPGKCLMPSHASSSSCGNLGSVISFYLYLALCILGLDGLLALVFYRTRLVPEVAVPCSPFKRPAGAKFWRHPLFSPRFARLWWGVAANFVNLGCQVTFAQFFIEHMKVNACASDWWASQCMSIAQGAFVLGRLAAAGLVTRPEVVRPRAVLLCFIAGAVATTAASSALTGSAAIAVAVMVMFFEAPSFPMVFESATADYEEWAPTCETIMIVSISGGALQPPLMAKLVESVRISAAWWLTAACFLVVFSYPLACNVIPSFRRSLDGVEMGRVVDEERKGSRQRAVARDTQNLKTKSEETAKRRVERASESESEASSC